MKQVKAIAEFIFEVDNTKSFEQIVKCIERQIATDLNAYYQNDDDTAQMTNLTVTYKVVK